MSDVIKIKITKNESSCLFVIGDAGGGKKQINKYDDNGNIVALTIVPRVRAESDLGQIAELLFAFVGQHESVGLSSLDI